MPNFLSYGNFNELSSASNIFYHWQRERLTRKIQRQIVVFFALPFRPPTVYIIFFPSPYPTPAVNKDIFSLPPTVVYIYIFLFQKICLIRFFSLFFFLQNRVFILQLISLRKILFLLIVFIFSFLHFFFQFGIILGMYLFVIVLILCLRTKIILFPFHPTPTLILFIFFSFVGVLFSNFLFFVFLPPFFLYLRVV